MAVKTIPNTSTEQPVQNRALDTNGTTSFTRSFKDAYATLKTFADGLTAGDTISGDMIVSWGLVRNPGDMGTLTISFHEDDTASGQGGTSQTALKAVWTCKSVRNDMSILAYCGGAASRVNLELWMKETDADTADANEFHKNTYETDDLNSQEIAIANKIRKGIESVIRFYPVLTCSSTWSRIPSTFMEDLGFVDTPGAPSADKTIAPNNLSSIISAHSWLKVQDDVSENADGTYRRDESWMGIKTTDATNGWDADLYGSNRWPMPVASAGTDT